jgi:uncharacterized protein YecE (DUF72 family)
MNLDLFGVPDPADASADQAGHGAAVAPAEFACAKSAAPPRRGRTVTPVRAAPVSQALASLATQLPAQIRLGTSSWSFPGWDSLVYDGEYSNSVLAKHGLQAYAAHPLLRSVSLDRSFYGPLALADYLGYAGQTPEHFRFTVKAPSSVTDAVLRDTQGRPDGLNPCFLKVDLAIREFITPCIEGLGARAGTLVFQFPPLPPQHVAHSADWIAQVGAFFAALPALPHGSCYAMEIRDAALLTPRLIKMLQAHGVRYCLAIHARMPGVLRQLDALALLDAHVPGPLVVRWSLHSGFKYEQAKAKYHPFNAIVDPDLASRTALAHLAVQYALAGQPVTITINNKAEGSAPLSCFMLAAQIVEALAQARGPA